MRINERGYWEGKEGLPHGVDLGLAKELARFFSKNNADLVFDLGCGNGFYTHYLNNYGGMLCEGYDGNPFTKELAGDNCYVADLSVPQEFGKANWVMSLEVAEHIPEEFEDVFIDNLHRHNTEGIVISWSIPTFGGDGHVNPKENSYVIDKFTKLGYKYDEDSTITLRYSCAGYPNPCWWFGFTIFVFRKDKNAI
jgi:SAM-dependent methyltransferase